MLLVALAQTPVVTDAVPDGALRGVVGTIFVLGLLVLLAWLLRRGTIALPGRRATDAVRVETAVPLGDRRSLVVVTVDNRRLLLGLTPTQVSLVTELEPVPAVATDSAPRFDQALAGRLDAVAGGGPA
ncbi:MAG TPA: flagellar biosynthetic protein FliO [Vicinamibacterales bacterium]